MKNGSVIYIFHKTRCHNDGFEMAFMYLFTCCHFFLCYLWISFLFVVLLLLLSPSSASLNELENSMLFLSPKLYKVQCFFSA